MKIVYVTCVIGCHLGREERGLDRDDSNLDFMRRKDARELCARTSLTIISKVLRWRNMFDINSGVSSTSVSGQKQLKLRNSRNIWAAFARYKDMYSDLPLATFIEFESACYNAFWVILKMAEELSDLAACISTNYFRSAKSSFSRRKKSLYAVFRYFNK